MTNDIAIRFCDEYLARNIADIDKEFLKKAKEALQQEQKLIDPAYEKTLNKWIGAEVLDRIRNEMHATAEKHEDGVYYLRDEWVDEIIDKYAEGSDKE